MFICKECKSLADLMFFDCMGDGYCEEHGGYAFYIDNLKIYCEECAKEQNSCQLCGKEINGRLPEE